MFFFIQGFLIQSSPMTWFRFFAGFTLFRNVRAKLHKDKLPPKLTNIQNSECGTESAKVKYIDC